MAEISSIAIREDSLIWTEISKGENTLNIERAVFEMLPIFIYHKSIQAKPAVDDLAKFLQELIGKHDLKKSKIRLSIPGSFGLIKKISADHSIPVDKYPELALFEFEKIWEEPKNNYHIYLPNQPLMEESRNEFFAVAIRKNVLEFLEKIFEKAGLDLESVGFSCFAVEELFRSFFPNSTGEALLLGWHRHGFDAILSDSKNFISYSFRPYTARFNPIERISEFDLASGFSNLLFDIQHPSILDNPFHSIQTIYNFGYFFKPEWMDFVRNRTETPSTLFTFDSSAEYQLTASDGQLTPDTFFRYIEPIANII